MKEIRNMINEATTIDELKRILIRLLNRVEDVEFDLDNNEVARTNDLRRMQEDICLKTDMELIDFL